MPNPRGKKGLPMKLRLLYEESNKSTYQSTSSCAQCVSCYWDPKSTMTRKKGVESRQHRPVSEESIICAVSSVLPVPIDQLASLLAATLTKRICKLRTTDNLLNTSSNPAKYRPDRGCRTSDATSSTLAQKANLNRAESPRKSTVQTATIHTVSVEPPPIHAFSRNRW